MAFLTVLLPCVSEISCFLYKSAKDDMMFSCLHQAQIIGLVSLLHSGFYRSVSHLLKDGGGSYAASTEDLFWYNNVSIYLNARGFNFWMYAKNDKHCNNEFPLISWKLVWNWSWQKRIWIYSNLDYCLNRKCLKKGLSKKIYIKLSCSCTLHLLVRPVTNSYFALIYLI